MLRRGPLGARPRPPARAGDARRARASARHGHPRLMHEQRLAVPQLADADHVPDVPESRRRVRHAPLHAPPPPPLRRRAHGGGAHGSRGFPPRVVRHLVRVPGRGPPGRAPQVAGDGGLPARRVDRDDRDGLRVEEGASDAPPPGLPPSRSTSTTSTPTTRPFRTSCASSCPRTGGAI